MIHTRFMQMKTDAAHSAVTQTSRLAIMFMDDSTTPIPTISLCLSLSLSVSVCLSDCLSVCLSVSRLLRLYVVMFQTVIVCFVFKSYFILLQIFIFLFDY